MGMFCRLGSFDDNLPVKVLAIPNEVWILFEILFFLEIRPSQYVDFNFCNCLQFNKCSAILCFSNLSFSKIFTSV